MVLHEIWGQIRLFNVEISRHITFHENSTVGKKWQYFTYLTQIFRFSFFLRNSKTWAGNPNSWLNDLFNTSTQNRQICFFGICYIHLSCCGKSGASKYDFTRVFLLFRTISWKFPCHLISIRKTRIWPQNSSKMRKNVYPRCWKNTRKSHLYRFVP